jgi:hypothetical protein
MALVALVASLKAHCHDYSFTPNEIFRVTRQNVNLGGIYRYTTLVNDSIPGPPLRIPENEVFWIRVYNDMTDDNLTMVSLSGVSATASADTSLI